MRTVFFLVNGILTMPGDARNWNERATTWLHTHRKECWGETVEYLSGPILSRMLGQSDRAKKLAGKLSAYDGWRIILVGHSNGADVIRDALERLKWPVVAGVFLFSPAIECGMNGYAEAIAASKIAVCRIYTGGKDHVLAWFGSIGGFLGYGRLGIDGPTPAVSALPGVSTINRDEFGHSDWWSDENFGWSMEQIAATSA